jgi:hypothetical protein
MAVESLAARLLLLGVRGQTVAGCLQILASFLFLGPSVFPRIRSDRLKEGAAAVREATETGRLETLRLYESFTPLFLVGKRAPENSRGTANPL